MKTEQELGQGFDQKLDLPLLDKAGSELEQVGVYEQRFTAEELEQLMDGTVDILLEKYHDRIEVDSREVQVSIADDIASVEGVVSVTHPMRTRIGFGCELSNSSEPGQIQGQDLK